MPELVPVHRRAARAVRARRARAPVRGARGDEGGNIGGVDQASNRLRVHPADGPMRLVDASSADPWAGQVAAVLDWLDRGEAPTEATGAQATLALRVSPGGQPLDRERRRRRRLALRRGTWALVAASSASAAATASRSPRAHARVEHGADVGEAAAGQERGRERRARAGVATTAGRALGVERRETARRSSR